MIVIRLDGAGICRSKRSLIRGDRDLSGTKVINLIEEKSVEFDEN
ncbi:hypothetical protein [Salinibacillus aidingensis]